MCRLVTMSVWTKLSLYYRIVQPHTSSITQLSAVFKLTLLLWLTNHKLSVQIIPVIAFSVISHIVSYCVPSIKNESFVYIVILRNYVIAILDTLCALCVLREKSC